MKARHGVLALLATGTMINYLDRAILGIASPRLSQDLALDPAEMGLLFSAFSWSYALMQVPGGAFLDRVGNKLTYLLSVASWSLTTLLHAFAGGFATLLGLRGLLGIAESPCFPANSRMVAEWFPVEERAFATSVYTVGEYVGLAFLAPLLYWVLDAFSWRALFLLAGGLGLAFSLVWAWRYRPSTAENPAHRRKTQWSDALRLMRHRQMWGICLGQFAGNSTLVFFLTWFPTYLRVDRHVEMMDLRWSAALPFVAAGAGVMFVGRWSDGMLKRGASLDKARKLPITIGLALASTVVTANYVENNNVVIALMSLAFFAQGMVSMGWALVAEIAPPESIGIAGGVFNLFANMAGVLTPLIVGVIAKMTGSFEGALIYIGLVGLAGALAYGFVLGPLKRISL